ncbi:sensor histidine kinase [Paenibacillus sp. SEL3]
MNMIFKGRNFRFRDFSLSIKLIIVYIVLTVIPISVLGVIAYRQYTTSIVEQIGEYMPRFLDQANLMIEQRIDQLTSLPEQLFNSGEAVRILRKGSYQSSSDLNNDKYVMNNYLSATYLERSNPDVLGVFIYSKNRLFSAARMDFSGMNEDSPLIPYGQDLDFRGKVKMLLSTDFSLKFQSGEPFLIIMKEIGDVENRTDLGTMFIAVKLSFIDDVLLGFEKNENAVFWLMNDQGEIFYNTDRKLIGTFDRDLKKYPILEGSFLQTLAEESTIMSISRSPSYKWLLVHSTRLQDMTRRSELVWKVTKYLYVGLAIITIVISILFSLRVTRPLEKLSRLMREVEQGHFNVDPGIHTKDEVGMLASSFISMVTTIQDLIQRNVQIELSQKEAELYALQSQINPHFMYNTLEMISMAVEEGERENVVKMVALLGRMLRFSVSNKARFVPIGEEIAHVRDYLTIQNFRFEDRLSFEIIEKGEVGLYTPKFILQPLVENAIKYGMETRQQLHIRIEIIKTGEWGDVGANTEFRIIDNGPGIPEDKLEELHRQLKQSVTERKDSGFGLKNVHARIQFMLGKEYGLRLESQYGQGTNIIVHIPVLDLNSAYILSEGKK